MGLRWVTVLGFIFLVMGCSGGLSDESLGKLPPNEAGRKVFEASCMRCHTIQGKGGVRGPNLSKVGAKYDKETLQRFIRDPQAVKPGSKMPTLSLSDLQIERVAGYLTELK